MRRASEKGKTVSSEHDLGGGERTVDTIVRKDRSSSSKGAIFLRKRTTFFAKSPFLSLPKRSFPLYFSDFFLSGLHLLHKFPNSLAFKSLR